MNSHLNAVSLAALLLFNLSTLVSSSSYKRPKCAFTRLPLHHRSTSHMSSPAPAILLGTVTNEIASDAPSDLDPTDPESNLALRNRIVALSLTLASNSRTGKFLTRFSDGAKLQNAIIEIEGQTSSPLKPMGEREKNFLVGDWTLVVTANVANPEIRSRWKSKDNKASGWSFDKFAMKGKRGSDPSPFQRSFQKSIEVTQRIRTDGENERRSENVEINRIDNVIEFTPLDTLEDIIPKEFPLYGFLSTVNVNPLKVMKSKLVLVHKAKVESTTPVLRTKLSLVSSVLNIAGSSQFFDPEGSDVFGANIPLGEFTGGGTFDTVYVDEDVRISRTRGPLFEKLRVFVRKGGGIVDSDIVESLMSELRVEETIKTSHRASSADARVQKAVDAAASVRDAVTSIGDNVRGAVQGEVDELNRALGDAMNNVVEKVQDTVEEDLQAIGKAIEEVQNSLESDGVEDVEAEVTGDAFRNVGKEAVDVGEAVEDPLD